MKTYSRKQLIQWTAAGVLGITVLIGITRLFKGSDSTAEENLETVNERFSSLSSGARVQGEGHLLQYGFTPGKRYTYSINRKVELRFAGKPGIGYRYIGKVALHVLKRTEIGYRIIAEFLPTDFTDITTAEKLEAPKDAFQVHNRIRDRSLLLAELTTAGELVDLSLPSKPRSATSDQFTKVTFDLLWQVIRPLPQLRDETEEWVENDLSGKFKAKYALEDSPKNTLLIRMNKEKYLSEGASAAVSDIQKSEWKMTWDTKEKILNAVEGAEILSSRNTALLEGEGNSTVTASLEDITDAEFTTDDQPLFSEGMTPTTLAQLGTESVSSSVSWSTAQTTLQRLTEVDSLSEEDFRKLFIEVSSLLKSKPELVSQYLALARRLPPDSEGFRLIIGSLAYAATPEAQAALFDVYELPQLSSARRQDILEKFATLDGPMSPETKSRLRELERQAQSRTERTTASLSLGASLQTQPDPELAKQILASWKAAKFDEQKTIALAVMGNGGDGTFLPAIQTALDSSNSDVRAAALSALRHNGSSEAETLLIQSIGGEKDAAVRSAGYAAFSSRPATPASNQALLQGARDPDLSVRWTAVRILLDRRTDPAVMSGLQKVAESETNSELQDFVSNQLMNPGD